MIIVAPIGLITPWHTTAMATMATAATTIRPTRTVATAWGMVRPTRTVATAWGMVWADMAVTAWATTTRPTRTVATAWATARPTRTVAMAWGMVWADMAVTAWATTTRPTRTVAMEATAATCRHVSILRRAWASPASTHIEIVFPHTTYTRTPTRRTGSSHEPLPPAHVSHDVSMNPVVRVTETVIWRYPVSLQQSNRACSAEE